MSEPLALVTINVTSKLPTVLKQIFVGFCTVDVDGVPPENVQLQLAGALELLSVKSIQLPTQKLLFAVKLAVGGALQAAAS